MSSRRKIVINSRKPDGSYCFKAESDKCNSRNIQRYGRDIGVYDVSTEAYYLKKIENLKIEFLEENDNLEGPKQGALSYLYLKRCLMILKVIKSLSFVSALIFPI
jgi:hypothetical protein